jgi:hypothetical protein
MSTKKIPLLLLLFAAGWPLLSAQSVRGVVRDSSGTLLGQASVVAYDQGGKVLAFSYSDASGRYQLSFASGSDTLVLVARLIGYQPQTLRVARREPPTEADFTLGGGEVLQLVEVRSRSNPVTVRGDTTAFKVSRYADSTEFSVEDLLKKLPGVRVDDNGQISYNNKPIERVMIEGDDLFGSQYVIGTRNLRAQSIEGVQVIDHFQDNPLLRDVRSSEKMVMNLQLKSDRKRRASADAEAEAGWGGRGPMGRAHVNLFSVSRKEKLYAIVNANNIGHSAAPLQEMDFGRLLAMRKKQQDLETAFPAQAALPLPVLEKAGLPVPYTQPNRTGLVFAGAVLPQKWGWRTKTSAWMSRTSNWQDARSDTRYLLPGDELTITETKETAVRRRTAHWQAEAQLFPPNGRYGIRCYGQISGNPANYDLDIRRSPALDGTENIRGAGQREAQNGHFSIEFTRKIRENVAFQWIAKAGWYADNSRLEGGYGFYSAYFQRTDSVERLLQITRQRQAAAYTAVMWTGRIKGWEWHLESGADYTRHRLTSDVWLLTTGWRVANAGEAFQNDYTFSTPLLFTGGYMQRKMARSTLQLRLKAGWLPLWLREAATETRRKTAFVLLPRVQWRREAGEYGSVNIQYEYEQAPPGVLQMMPRRMFSDYQSVSKGLPDLSLTEGHRASVRYLYNRPTRHFIWHIGSNLQSSSNQFGGRFIIQPFLSERAVFRPVARRGWGANAGFERYVSRIRSLFIADVALSQSQEFLQFEETPPSRFQQNAYTLHLQYGTAFDTWVNGTLESSRTQNVGKNLLTGVEAPSVGWLSVATLRIKPVSAFDAKILLYRVANRANGQTFQISHAAGAQAFWRFPRYRSVVSFNALNLLFNTAYQQVFSDAFSQYVSRIQAVPAFFTIGWEKQL